jgi:hypothetical protein
MLDGSRALQIIAEVTESQVLCRSDAPRQLATRACLVGVGAELLVEDDILIARVGATPQAANVMQTC